MEILTYQAKKNFIINAHSIVKLLYFIVIFIDTFLFFHPVYFGLIFLILITWITLAQSHQVWSYVRMILFFSLIVGIINILLDSRGTSVLIQGPQDIWLLKKFHITAESLINSALIIARLAIILLIFGLINTLNNPDDLMQIFAKLHAPSSLSIIIMISLRYFPILIQDLQHIEEIQRCRGIEFEKGRIIRRIRNSIALLLPLLTNSLDRSVQTAEALETRGFHLSQKRYYYYGKKLVWSEWVSLLFICGLMVGSILLYINGYGYLVIFPTQPEVWLTRTDLIYLSLYLGLNLGILGVLKLADLLKSQME